MHNSGLDGKIAGEGVTDGQLWTPIAVYLGGILAVLANSAKPSSASASASTPWKNRGKRNNLPRRLWFVLAVVRALGTG